MGNLWDFLITTWPGQLICALLCWAMAALKYWHISTRGISLFHWFDLIVYGALGKWGIVYLWVFFGALFTFVGIWNLVVRICYGKSDDG
jgi:hypothetical protein